MRRRIKRLVGHKLRNSHRSSRDKVHKGAVTRTIGMRGGEILREPLRATRNSQRSSLR